MAALQCLQEPGSFCLSPVPPLLSFCLHSCKMVALLFGVVYAFQAQERNKNNKGKRQGSCQLKLFFSIFFNYGKIYIKIFLVTFQCIVQ